MSTKIPTTCVVCGQSHSIVPGSGGFYIDLAERRSMNRGCVIAMRQACRCAWDQIITSLYGRMITDSPQGVPVRVYTPSSPKWRDRAGNLVVASGDLKVNEAKWYEGRDDISVE